MPFNGSPSPLLSFIYLFFLGLLQNLSASLTNKDLKKKKTNKQPAFFCSQTNLILSVARKSLFASLSSLFSKKKFPALGLPPYIRPLPLEYLSPFPNAPRNPLKLSAQLLFFVSLFLFKIPPLLLPFSAFLSQLCPNSFHIKPPLFNDKKDHGLCFLCMVFVRGFFIAPVKSRKSLRS